MWSIRTKLHKCTRLEEIIFSQNIMLRLVSCFPLSLFFLCYCFCFWPLTPVSHNHYAAIEARNVAEGSYSKPIFYVIVQIALQL